MKRSGRRRLTDEELLAAGVFWDAARMQTVCAECGRGGSFDAHHVIERQELRNQGLNEWDLDNALRLCDRPVGGCHQNHTAASKRVRLERLTDRNIDFAFRALGPAAYDYLKRRYGGDDPRVERKLKEASE